jgi:hypothetical protein
MDITSHPVPINAYLGVLHATFSLSVATTVVSTILIVIQILRTSRVPGKTRAKSHTAVETIIESALLYSVTSLIFIPMINPESESSSTYYLYAQVFAAHMAVSFIDKLNEKPAIQRSFTEYCPRFDHAPHRSQSIFRGTCEHEIIITT